MAQTTTVYPNCPCCSYSSSSSSSRSSASSSGSSASSGSSGPYCYVKWYTEYNCQTHTFGPATFMAGDCGNSFGQAPEDGWSYKGSSEVGGVLKCRYEAVSRGKLCIDAISCDGEIDRPDPPVLPLYPTYCPCAPEGSSSSSGSKSGSGGSSGGSSSGNGSSGSGSTSGGSGGSSSVSSSGPTSSKTCWTKWIYWFNCRTNTLSGPHAEFSDCREPGEVITDWGFEGEFLFGNEPTYTQLKFYTFVQNNTAGCNDNDDCDPGSPPSTSPPQSLLDANACPPPPNGSSSGGGSSSG